MDIFIVTVHLEDGVPPEALDFLGLIRINSRRFYVFLDFIDYNILRHRLSIDIVRKWHRINTPEKKELDNIT